MLGGSAAPMPLFSISPNIQETEAVTRKIIGNEYLEDNNTLGPIEESPHCEDPAQQKILNMSTSAIDCPSMFLFFPSSVTSFHLRILSNSTIISRPIGHSASV